MRIGDRVRLLRGTEEGRIVKIKDNKIVEIEIEGDLKAKLHIETSEFSKDKIKSLLEQKQVNNNSTVEFISILEHCELARYTPITQVEMNQDYEKSARTISIIDRELK